MSLQQILDLAMDLGVEERAALARELLASLDSVSEEESERRWGLEAERRLESIRDASARTVRAEDVHARARQLLGG